jgi:DNA-binding transcriptional ArsR family regulator
VTSRLFRQPAWPAPQRCSAFALVSQTRDSTVRAKIHSNDHILETPLDALQPGELAVRDLTSRFDSSRPVIRQQVRVLLTAGLVGERRTGRENYYRLEPDPLVAVNEWVRHYEKFRSGKLQNLQTVLNDLQ